jgi:WD40 repeat protein
MAMWLVDTGQKLKQFSNTHSGAEVTCMVLDETETRLLTGGTDGLIKMWDFNGHCYHVLHCNRENHPCDVGFILSLKVWTQFLLSSIVY